jgi:hypothetical protein
MSDSLRYHAIQKLFGEKWLNDSKNRANHPLFSHCNEIDFLSTLNEYLDFIGCVNKSVVNDIKNGKQFFDTYFELEIAYFLKKLELKPKLHEIICGEETDIFLEEQKLVIEIKHLLNPDRVESKKVRINLKSKFQGVPEAIDLTYLNMERIRDYLLKKKFQEIYPIIVCFCPDTMFALQCYDIENLLNELINPDYKIVEVSALAFWRHKKIECLFVNPRGKKLALESSELKKFFNIT